jgi:hypothetical protein
MATPARATPSVPRRDAAGRVLDLPELLGVAALFAAVNGLGLLLIDGLLALARVTSFGDSSGWLILILPALLYFEEFKAWRDHRLRWLVAAVSAAVGAALGLAAAGLAEGWPSLASGAAGALVAALAYAPVWFLGIRRLTGVTPSPLEKGKKR